MIRIEILLYLKNLETMEGRGIIRVNGAEQAWRCEPSRTVASSQTGGEA